MADQKPPEAPFEPVDGIRLIASYVRHRQFVEEGLHLVTSELERRGKVHDASKMLADEFAGFSKINAHARIHKCGSDEYREAMLREAVTVNLHFSRNSHHPEFATLNAAEMGTAAAYAEEGDNLGIDMTFLDVIEMVCDWWGARKGYDDARSWPVGVQMNLATKGKYLKPWQVELVHSVAAYLDGTGRA